MRLALLTTEPTSSPPPGARRPTAAAHRDRKRSNTTAPQCSSGRTRSGRAASPNRRCAPPRARRSPVRRPSSPLGSPAPPQARSAGHAHDGTRSSRELHPLRHGPWQPPTPSRRPLPRCSPNSLRRAHVRTHRHRVQLLPRHRQTGPHHARRPVRQHRIPGPPSQPAAARTPALPSSEAAPPASDPRQRYRRPLLRATGPPPMLQRSAASTSADYR